MIEILDGGMLFELNKKYKDLGQFAIVNDQKLIKEIYQKYIDMGCEYITTCNYGFKSLKLDNWFYLVYESINIIKKIKLKNPNIKVLGCLPPYFESYHNGKIDNNFIDYYTKIIISMKNCIDFFIMETQINCEHIEKILCLIKNYSSKKVIISVYPNKFLKEEELIEIINKYKDNIYCLSINCCSFEDVKKYFFNNIDKIGLVSKNIKFGFYCNNIDEKMYCNFQGNKKNNVKIEDFKNEKIINNKDLSEFIDYLNKKKYNIIVGGCCGYGINEMKNLISILKVIDNKK